MNTIFESLQNAANRLNTTADAANELIREANVRLAEVGAGVPFVSSLELRDEVVARIDDDNDRDLPPGNLVDHMAYAKIHGTWQLGIESSYWVPGHSGEDGDLDLVSTDITPLLNADREIRILAASLLPRFLGAYTKHLSELADKLSSESNED